METGDNQVKSSGNPIIDKMRAQQEAPAEQPAAQQVEEQQHEQFQETEEPAQTEQVEPHIESNSQQETQTTNESAEEDTGLEITNGDNPSTDHGGENAEEGAASTSAQEDDWWKGDNGVFEETSTENIDLPEGDYSAIGKALGLENAKAPDVIGRISEMTTQNQELTEKIAKMEENSNYATPDLEAANEVARNGGDYLGFLGLSQNNWDEVPDDVLLVEGKLKSAFGEDENGMMSYLNEMDPVQKRLMASEIRQGLKEHDEHAKGQIVSRANEKRREIDQGLKAALDGTSELFGLKMTPALKRETYDDVTGKNFLNSIFHDKDGKPSPERMMKAAVVMKNINKIVQTAVTRAKNQSTGEILDEVSNPVVQRNGQMANPTLKEQPSAFQKHFSNLKGPKR